MNASPPNDFPEQNCKLNCVETLCMESYGLLMPSETLLQGKWLMSDGEVVADHVSRRIQYLVSSVLLFVARDGSGWVSVFKDPKDLRYWELSYPDSQDHGGGAPMLRCIDSAEVDKKYSAT